jgi:hypothetical protein
MLIIEILELLRFLWQKRVGGCTKWYNISSPNAHSLMTFPQNVRNDFFVKDFPERP